MSEQLNFSFSKIKYSIVMRHFMRRRMYCKLLNDWDSWEKYIELIFDSKGDLYCIKDKVHI